MIYLFDTCTLKHELGTGQKVDEVAEYCKKNNLIFCISNEIIKELEPNKNKLSKDEFNSSHELYAYVDLLAKSNKIELINIEEDEDIFRNFSKIRKTHYGWMKNRKYCMDILGLKASQISSKSFKYKDVGECSLIAIALTNPSIHIIISEDKGQVHLHPNINIFDEYKYKGIVVSKYYETDLCHEFLVDSI